ncbi:hypothetical protein, partial [Paracoccus versutus]
ESGPWPLPPAGSIWGTEKALAGGFVVPAPAPRRLLRATGELGPGTGKSTSILSEMPGFQAGRHRIQNEFRHDALSKPFFQRPVLMIAVNPLFQGTYSGDAGRGAL